MILIHFGAVPLLVHPLSDLVIFVTARVGDPGLLVMHRAPKLLFKVVGQSL